MGGDRIIHRGAAFESVRLGLLGSVATSGWGQNEMGYDMSVVVVGGGGIVGIGIVGIVGIGIVGIGIGGTVRSGGSWRYIDG